MSANTPGSPPHQWPARIQSMLAMQRLREQATSRENVIAMWGKAVESAHDAELVGMSLDGSLRAAYDAGHVAALALLAAHGLRPSSGRGHHEMAFAGAAGFNHAGLENLVSESEEVRSLRAGSMYEAVAARPEDRQLALGWMRRTLPAMHRVLVAVDPLLAKVLTTYAST